MDDTTGTVLYGVVGNEAAKSGGSGSTVIGHKYFMGVHAILCHGEVDEVSEFIIGERSAWQGSVTENTALVVNRPSLFGGNEGEGGVVGVIDLMFGGMTQPVNDYLSRKITGAVPAYRGLVSAVFRGASRGFQWSAMNPYFKSPWFRVRRALKGWSRGEAWFPEKAIVGTVDMNPAHIIYESYTDQEWGMGYSPEDLDDANFRQVATTLHNEGFGLSLLWIEQDSIGNFIDLILKHIDGVRRYDIRTGKLQIKLLRDDYDLDTIPELNESNILEVSSFQRTAWADTVNEVIVKYTDRSQNATTVTVQNLASIDAQGAVVSKTNTYVGIRDINLARRVGMRDLANVSSPLAKVTLICNRTAWDWMEGDVFKFTWPKLGISGAPFRVIKIDKGTLSKGQITIDAIEDFFKMPTDAYLASQKSSWVDPRNLPAPVVNSKVVESPYWDIVRALDEVTFSALPSGWAFVELLAAKPTSDAYHYMLLNSATDSNYKRINDSAQFIPGGTLASAIQVGVDNVTITFSDSSEIDLCATGNYLYIDNECLGVVTVNYTTEAVTCSRGVLDTVPAYHAAGAKVLFATGLQPSDTTERTSNETTYYKLLTVTGRGRLDDALAPTKSITTVGRAHKPYPPANLQINGNYYPATVTDEPIMMTWAHRDRTQQTVDLTPYSHGNIGPEPGATYTVTVFDVTLGTLIEEVAGITATTFTSDYPFDNHQVKVSVKTVVDGRDSLYKAEHTMLVDNFDMLSNPRIDMLFGGTAGSTAFVDESGRTATPFGDIHMDGSGYAVLDGSGDYLSIVNPRIPLGTADFELTAVINLSSYANYRTIFDTRESHASTAGFVVGVDAAGHFYFYANGGFRISEGSVALNTDVEVKLIRTGDVFSAKINGTPLATTYTWAANFTRNTALIGASWPLDSFFHGKINSLHLT